MKLRGFPPAGPPSSYVSKPQGSIIGSSVLPISKIVAVPGNPGKDGAPGEVTLAQLNTGLAAKLNRLGEGFTTRVYVNNAAGAPSSIPYNDTAAEAGSIVRRTTTGNVVAADPTAAAHTATKNYVDTTTPKIADGAVISGPNNLGGALGTWAPEAAGFVHLPHLFNDLAYNGLRGGSTTVTQNGTAVASSSIPRIFEPNTSALSIALVDKATDIFVVEVTTAVPFRYGTVVGIAMPAGFRGKNVVIEGWYNGVWNPITTRTAVETGVVVQSISVPSSATAGMTKLRYTIKDFHSSASFRISSVFAMAYDSPLLEAGFVSRGGGTLYGALSYPADPVSANDLARKSYVDTKLSKVTGVNRIYTNDSAGNPSAINYTSGTTGSTMMFRDGSGRSKANDPSDVLDVANKQYVDAKVAGIVNSAPATLDTLDELAAALGDDPNFATTVATQIGNLGTSVDGKVTKVTGAYKVYATDGGGAQTTASWSFDPNPITVVVRTDQGRITAAAPAAATDVANKKYVDDHLPWTGTQAQYDALATKDPARVYVVVP